MTSIDNTSKKYQQDIDNKAANSCINKCPSNCHYIAITLQKLTQTF